MNTQEYEDQQEIFYAILTGYVKHKIGGEVEWEVWQEKAGEILKENWLRILATYTLMLKWCGLSKVFTLDVVLQGDDANHYASYAYAKFLAPNAEPNEMYDRCEQLMSKLVLNAATGSAEEN